MPRSRARATPGQLDAFSEGYLGGLLGDVRSGAVVLGPSQEEQQQGARRSCCHRRGGSASLDNCSSIVSHPARVVATAAAAVLQLHLFLVGK